MKPGALAKQLEKLGLRAREDFLLHLPLRYEDETRLAPPGEAPPVTPVYLEARVVRTEIAYRPRRQLVVHARWGEIPLALRFFNFYPSQLRQFQRAADEGALLRAYGEVRSGWFGAEMAHPRYRLVGEGEPLADALTPVYPTTAGVSQAQLRARVREALESAPLEDTLPEALLRRHGLPAFEDALRALHEPAPDADRAALVERTHPAWQRVKFDELLAQQLSMRLAYRARRGRAAPALPIDGALLSGLRAGLPFELTGAQQRVLTEVLADLAQPHPMQRLLQGDVGSGKTIIAALACLAAADGGWQSVVMAPTEILAEQHVRKFSEWLAPLGVKL
ncbi:MAG: DEAD/DEAH box helicase, partial [Burkholderiales bacterium]|nr:DEAD/DEAH box helicase [Burkholderiales bacterium]